jgi:hypothetical protein
MMNYDDYIYMIIILIIIVISSLIVFDCFELWSQKDIVSVFVSVFACFCSCYEELQSNAPTIFAFEAFRSPESFVESGTSGPLLTLDVTA